jgi:hypothetical protein
VNTSSARFADIQSQARSSGQSVSELARLYTLEGMLGRISASEFADDFILKGGVLLAAFSLRRPTKDIDVEATRISNDVHDVTDRIMAVAALDLDDGITFDLPSIRSETIRDGDDYQGIRVKLTGLIGRSKNVIGLDISFGDPIFPAPKRLHLPRLLERDPSAPISILGYPLTMVIAEKVVTMMQRGEANTRWRDFADTIAIATTHTVSENDLRASLTVVATHRRIQLEPLALALYRMPDLAQPKWRSWRNNQAHRDVLPERFSDALAYTAAFIDPVVTGASSNRMWHPASLAWQ